MRLTAYTLCLIVMALGAPAHASVERSLLYAQEGVNALMRGNNARAIESYDKALADENLPPLRRAGILNDRGVAHWREGRHQQALDDFAQSIALNPDFAPVYNNRGNVLMQIGRIEEAIADFTRAIELAPAYGAAFHNRGNAYLVLGRLREAETDLRRAIALLPASAAPLNSRGKLADQQARPFAGLRYLNRAILLNRNYPSAYRNRAAALIKVRHYDAALRDLEQAAATADGDERLLILRGRVQAAAGDHQAAVQDFAAALGIEPDNGEALAGRGMAQLARGRIEDALSDCDMAVTFAPEHAQAYLCRAQAYLRLGQPVLTSTNVSRALELSPDLAEAHVVRAQLAEEAGDMEAALGHYRKALALDPLLDSAQTALARLSQDESAQVAAPAVASVGEPLDGWRIVKGHGPSYYALNDEQRGLAVPLETYEGAQPALVEWTPLTQTLRGFGLLRYRAIAQPGHDAEAELPHEMVAILDLGRKRVVAVEPYLVRGEKAKWEWGQYGVTVTDPEGVPSAHQLREEPKPRVVRQQPERQLEDDRWSFEEWGRGNFGARQERRRWEQQRRREPRNLFDWLFR